MDKSEREEITMVRFVASTGHDNIEPDVEMHQFATPEEAAAFVKGVELTSDSINGWLEGRAFAVVVD